LYCGGISEVWGHCPERVKMKRASESTHWYKEDGEPMYTIIGKNGKERNTTLRDARVLNLKPSVTSIIKLAATPFLQSWIIDQHIMACLTTERLADETEEVYINRIKTDANEHARNAAAKGTTIHAYVQSGFEGEEIADEGKLYFDAAQRTLDEECGEQEWRCEESFATDSYGGKIDLQTDELLIDIKTTEKDLDTVQIWDSHYMQLAAYDHGQGKRCGILYINVNTAEAKLLWAEPEEISRGLDCFNALVAFWRAKNRVA